MAATIMVALDTTIVNVALHEIGTDLEAGAGIEWVITAYLLAVCASQPATGWLADRFGRKPVFLGSVLAFTIASLLCGLAPNLGLLVVARALQGLGGGAMMPVGMAIALELFPPERRGRAIATWGVSAMAAPAIGPTVGGWLINQASWHWLFFINLPIGVAVLVFGLRILRSTGPVERRPFDAAGLGLGSGGLTIAVLGVSQGAQWGWSATSTLLCIVGGPMLLAGFVYRELHSDHPLIDMSMFSVPSFRLAIGAMMLVQIAQYSRLVFLPLQLQEGRGYTAFRVGLLFIPAAVAGAIGMQIGGRLVDTIGPRKPIVAGAVGVSVAMLGFWQLDIGSPIALVVVLMSLQGIAWGITMSPSMVAGIGQVPRRLIPQATAVRSLAQQVAGAVAVAVLGAVAATRMGDDPTPGQAWHAYGSVYLVTGGTALAAALIALRIPGAVEHVAHDADTDEALAEGAIAALLE